MMQASHQRLPRAMSIVGARPVACRALPRRHAARQPVQMQQAGVPPSGGRRPGDRQQSPNVNPSPSSSRPVPSAPMGGPGSSNMPSSPGISSRSSGGTPSSGASVPSSFESPADQAARQRAGGASGGLSTSPTPSSAANVPSSFESPADQAARQRAGGASGGLSSPPTLSSGANMPGGFESPADQAEMLRAGGQQPSRAVDQTAGSAQDGVDQAADAAKGTVSQGADQAEKAADNLQDAAEDARKTAQRGAERLERNFDQAAGQAGDVLDQAADQLQKGAQGAVDTVQQTIEEVRKRVGSSRPAPYAFQPLTVLATPPPMNGTSSTGSHRPGSAGGGRQPPGHQDSEDGASKQTDWHKLRLLQSVAGLDRGFAANSTATALVESAVLSLTGTSEAVALSWTPGEGKQATMQQLAGTWRLIYSSGFARGSIAGNRPAPPQGLLPLQLGQVYQVISPYATPGTLDNVVELYSKLVVPALPGLPQPERAVFTATLKHTMETVGGSAVQITFEDTEVRATGGPLGYLGNLPDIMLPQLPEGLRPSKQARTSTFDVLYLDDDMRITRGSRGELRVFVKSS